jgi:hypothetical protein
MRCGKTYVAHNRLFREHYLSVQISSRNIFLAVFVKESRNGVRTPEFQNIYTEVKICSFKPRYDKSYKS